MKKVKGSKKVYSFPIFDLLVAELEKYGDKSVAIADLKSLEVLAFGEDPELVRQEAAQQGLENPIVFLLPGFSTLSSCEV